MDDPSASPCEPPLRLELLLDTASEHLVLGLIGDLERALAEALAK